MFGFTVLFQVELGPRVDFLSTMTEAGDYVCKFVLLGDFRNFYDDLWEHTSSFDGLKEQVYLSIFIIFGFLLVNNVILAIVAIALSKYMEEARGDPTLFQVPQPLPLRPEVVNMHVEVRA
ncbi:hypothetical protein CYMTET_9959 [Cymbomonas tetramitiformis]|uniref:Ion transport domain-containing protein n=1 Tax=Cymbomonas tetramitiformis TaxID=36881 RepID=A0AAE0LEZ1_9CHLO|nr:hypothetical protein CYMTET_9959 [Cymbomonas tetramitiformis]